MTGSSQSDTSLSDCQISPEQPIRRTTRAHVSCKAGARTTWKTRYTLLGVEPSTFYCFGFNLLSCLIRRENSHHRDKERVRLEPPQCSISLKGFRLFTSFRGQMHLIGRRRKRKVSLVFFISHPAATSPAGAAVGHKVTAFQEQGRRLFRGKNRGDQHSAPGFIYLFTFARLVMHDASEDTELNVQSASVGNDSRQTNLSLSQSPVVVNMTLMLMCFKVKEPAAATSIKKKKTPRLLLWVCPTTSRHLLCNLIQFPPAG